MASVLLGAAKPYLTLLACFTLTPPPAFILNENAGDNSRFWLLAYAYYALLMLALSTWAAYMNNFMLDVIAVDQELDSITNVLGIVQNVIVALVHAVYLLNMFVFYQPLRRIYATISELERSINESTITPTAPIQPVGLRWRLKTRAGILSLFLFVTMPRVNVPLFTDTMTLTNKMITGLIHFLVQLKTVEYCVIVLLVQELLLRLHGILEQIKLELESVATKEEQQQKPLLAAMSFRLRVNQHILARIWLLVTQIESYFTLPMLFLFLYNGVAITHTINWAYIMSLTSYDCCRYLRLANVPILIMNILIPCWLSRCCINTYNQYATTLHKLKSDGHDFLLTLHIREYSMQLMHQQLAFTCGGFFDIDLKYFGGFILTIITYVVILIQFKMQAEAERGKQHLHATKNNNA